MNRFVDGLEKGGGVDAAFAHHDGGVFKLDFGLVVGLPGQGYEDSAEVADFLDFARHGLKEGLGLLAEAHAGGNLGNERKFFVDGGKVFGHVGEFAVGDGERLEILVHVLGDAHERREEGCGHERRLVGEGDEALRVHGGTLGEAREFLAGGVDLFRPADEDDPAGDLAAAQDRLENFALHWSMKVLGAEFG